MPCFHPLDAWRSWRRVHAKTGKPVIYFKLHKLGGVPACDIEEIKVECGKCIDCRLDYSRQWAMRCMHESHSHPQNCFITLTFNDTFLDPVMSLRKDTFSLFMKRLLNFIAYNYEDREKWNDFHDLYELRFGNCPTGRVRFYHAAEYGGKCLICGQDEEFCICQQEGLRYKPGRPHHHAILFGFDFPDKKFKKAIPLLSITVNKPVL